MYQNTNVVKRLVFAAFCFNSSFIRCIAIIVCKDSANRAQYKTNSVLFYFRDVTPTNSTAH